MAGGKSSRLGVGKALERINNQSLIERTIGCLSTVSRNILVVTSQEESNLIAVARLKGKVIADLYPEKGPLGGIYTGLAMADAFHSLVVGCDMPFLNCNLLHYLVDIALDFDVVVPRIDDMLEPLHAVYSKNCLPPIRQLLRENRLGVSQLFSLVRTKYVDKDEIDKFDPEHLSFFNINTYEDLEKARAMIKQIEQCSTVGKDEL